MALRPHPLLGLTVALAGCGGLAYYDGGGPLGIVGIEDTALLSSSGDDDDDTTRDDDPVVGDDDDDDDDTTPPDPSPGSEDCVDGVDNDGDQQVDCDDSDCDVFCDADGDGWLALAAGGDDCDDGDSSVNPGAPEVCGDGVDNDCAGGDCTDFSDDFESPSFHPAYTFSGAADWVLAPGLGQLGSTGAASGPIGHDQQSRIDITLNFPAGGSVDFWHMGSTELNYDKLLLYVDDQKRAEWSGTWSWTLETIPASPGSHTYSWRYKKDQSISNGQDAVMIDNIVAYGGNP